MSSKLSFPNQVSGMSRHSLLHPDRRTLMMPAIRRSSEQVVDYRPRLGKLLYLFLVCLVTDTLLLGGSAHIWLNWYLTIIWSAYLPLTIIGVWGAYTARREPLARRYTGTRGEPVVFLIPTVARPDTLTSLRRVVDSVLLCAPECFPNYLIHLVIEEGAPCLTQIQEAYQFYHRVCLLIVPTAYTPAGKTRYKARANQYALEQRRTTDLCGSAVFIYHMDDDTSIGHDTIWSIAHFIEADTHDLAQGVLTYPHQLSRSWFCRLADSIRPADDLSRFYFCTGKLGTPLAGLHGEHLLVRASVEDTIGWDFGPTTTVEDAYFGLHFAARYHGRAAFLPSCCYGASPSRLRDLIRQRRRWAAGLLHLLMDRRIPPGAKGVLLYSILNWTVGLLQHILLILLITLLTRAGQTTPVFSPILICWCANFAFQVWMYLEGLRINLEASQASRRRFLLLAGIQILAIPVISLVEATAACLGFLDFLRGKQGFDVISKGL